MLGRLPRLRPRSVGADAGGTVRLCRLSRPAGFTHGRVGNCLCMTGRVHVIHGDLTLLTCDVAIVPTDRLLRVEQTWSGLVTETEARAGAPEQWHGGGGGRRLPLPPPPGGGPPRNPFQG